MEFTAGLEELQKQLNGATADFKEHVDVNTFCEQVRDMLFNFAEETLAPMVEEAICKSEMLATFKACAGTMALRFHGYRTTSIRLLSGKSIQIRSPYFTKTKPKKRRGRKSKKRKAGTGCHFGLQYLGFVSRCSIMLASSVAQAALLCPSFELARKTLQSHSINLNVKTIHRICMNLGHSTIDYRGRISLNSKDNMKGKTVLVSLDGGRLRERVKKRGRKQEGQKRQGYRAEWRAPEQLVIHEVDKDGNILKRIPIYDATMGRTEGIMDLLKIYLTQLNISEADTVVFCCDGERSYWKRIPSLAKELGIKNHYQIIDYSHAKQNLFEIIARLPKKLTSKKLSRITNKWKNLLWEGKIDDLQHEIKKLITSPRNRKKALNKLKNYFLKNRNRMQYSTFRSMNLPIGSGCVESAIRRVINLRLKSPGIFWKKETAEVMLFLRSQLLSGRWGIMLANLFGTFRKKNAICH